MLRHLVLTVAIMSVAARPTQSAGNESGAELASAKSLLVAYLEDFAIGSYVKVAQYVSDDSWSTLREWNPPLAVSDSLRLLEAGCDHNGLMCLRVRSVESGEQIGEGEFRFLVRVANHDGTQLVRGPCCGVAIEQDPPDSVFAYTVRTGSGRVFAQQLPPYVT